MTALCVALMILMSGAAHATSVRESPNHRPNIVLIVADDLGWNSVGYHGGLFHTPHLDRIGRQGVVLERFYVSPMCSPTRAGLLRRPLPREQPADFPPP